MAKRLANKSALELENHLYECVKSLRITQEAHKESGYHRSWITPILNESAAVDRCLQHFPLRPEAGSLPALVRDMRKAETEFFKVRRHPKSSPTYKDRFANMESARALVDKYLKQLP
ncbi:hypothetical protein [Pontibacter mangrovi]|uniref:Uncharacterized protein n=1 Tax=Pontibacter mangrovi TaxID=2589816 RepID=A0A501W9A7_9BACT|nr:hypothetical protein [Pontibacter mangrovi]TPE44950.1 hypothetical protein FJM65_08010 [Pontibacter mangrovi]